MFKIATFLTLFTTYLIYTATVYFRGTTDTVKMPDTATGKIAYGKKLFQQYNCTSCHQLYGLGGYLGPELTTAYSDPKRGEIYMKSFLLAGGPRMPNFHFSGKEIEGLLSFLQYVDSSAISYKVR